MNCVTHELSSAYNHESNSLAEAGMRRAKELLEKCHITRAGHFHGQEACQSAFQNLDSHSCCFLSCMLLIFQSGFV